VTLLRFGELLTELVGDFMAQDGYGGTHSTSKAAGKSGSYNDPKGIYLYSGYILITRLLRVGR